MADNEKTVYIVDDDESVRKAFKKLLTFVGFDVHAFSSAEEFIEKTGSIKNGVIVLDMKMPGMTGIELLKRLTSHNSKIKVIAMSGYDDETTKELAEKMGVVAFFRKPVDDQALIDAIEWAMRERKG
jgi:two-component system response regulator FixJ